MFNESGLAPSSTVCIFKTDAEMKRETSLSSADQLFCAEHFIAVVDLL